MSPYFEYIFADEIIFLRYALRIAARMYHTDFERGTG